MSAAPEAPDPNTAAVRRAALDPAHARWLEEVAGLVDGRLDAVRPDWRDLPDSGALRAATYGLLLGLVASRYPTSREVVSRVAEAHPSFEALPATRRLAVLERLCESPALVARWIGPLLGVEDPAALEPLCAPGDGGHTNRASS